MKIVLVHGWASDSSVLSHLKDHLLETISCTIVSHDLPGFGSRAHERFACDKAVSELTVLFLSEPAIVIGWSLGGLLALKAHAAARVTQANLHARVLALCSPIQFVADTAWPHSMPEEAFEKFVQSYHTNPALCVKRFIALESTKTGSSLSTDDSQSVGSFEANASSKDVQESLRYFKPLNPLVDDKTARKIVSEAVIKSKNLRFSTAAGRDSLLALNLIKLSANELSSSCFLMYAERDSVVDLKNAIKLSAAVIANESPAQVIVLKDASHLLPITHADTVSKYVENVVALGFDA